MEPILYRLAVLSAICSSLWWAAFIFVDEGRHRWFAAMLMVLTPIAILLVYRALHWAFTGRFRRISTPVPQE